MIGDKTGAGGYGSRSIIAVIRTPNGAPWLAAVYLTGNEADMKALNVAIARIGAAMMEVISAAPNSATKPPERWQTSRRPVGNSRVMAWVSYGDVLRKSGAALIREPRNLFSAQALMMEIDAAMERL